MTTQPTAGAMRAAQIICDHHATRQAQEPGAPLYVGIVAEIIDRETGAGELLSVATEFVRRWEAPGGSFYEIGHEQLAEQARAAIAKAQATGGAA